MKTLYFQLLFLVSVIAGCSSPKIDPYNPWNIADNDTVIFQGPGIGKPIPGIVFKAINPRFIANAYGVKEKYESDFKGVKKEFELVAFDNYSIIPNYYDPKPLTTLNVRKKWNYYINNDLAFDYSRVLVSAFLLQAFEKVEYIASDSTKGLFAFGMPSGSYVEDNPSDKYSYETRSRDGTIRVYIKNISQSVINDEATLYLINGRVVTRKIYEAINPVYIRSLKRITNQPELTEYKQKKNIKEVVEVELFTYKELNSNITLCILDDCPECDVYIVDNVQIDSDIYDALRSIFYKSVRVISEKDKEAFAPYRKLFPEKKFEFGDKRVTIISL